MKSLATWLEHRQPGDLKWRTALTRATAEFPAPLRKLVSRAVWPGGLKHMRYLPPRVTLSVGADRRWVIFEGGRALAASKPLGELIPEISVPASIVATGPTALNYPWGRSESKFVIAVNGAPTMLKSVGKLPDLMVVTDREFALTGIRHFEAAPGVPLAIEFLAAAALAATTPHVLTERPFTILERVNLWHGLPSLDDQNLRRLNLELGSPFVLPTVADPKCRIGWSRRPEIGIFSGRNVVFSALQIAIGLGAKDLEIIGMDLGGGRAYPEDSGARPSQLGEHYESYILPSFQIMAESLKGSDVSIENVSPMCPLPKHLFPTAV